MNKLHMSSFAGPAVSVKRIRRYSNPHTSSAFKFTEFCSIDLFVGRIPSMQCLDGSCNFSQIPIHVARGLFICLSVYHVFYVGHNRVLYNKKRSR